MIDANDAAPFSARNLGKKPNQHPGEGFWRFGGRIMMNYGKRIHIG
jgi:hypothetical protein